MIAAQDLNISEAAETIYELSEDECIRLECEAREDFLKRQHGMETMIAEQALTIAEKDKELAENAQTIDAQKREIDRLKALLAERK